MAVSIEVLEDDPIMIFTLSSPINPETDPVTTSSALLDFQSERGGLVARISDFRQTKLTFNHIFMGMPRDASMKNPNIRHFFVGNSDMVKMAAESFGQEQYGGVEVKVFATREEAIEAARQALKYAV